VRADGAARPRARQAGVPFDGEPGPFNAITDVASVEVGHATLVQGDSVRTGVTAIWPRGRSDTAPVFGSCFSMNGNGELTGAAWIAESGFVDGPVMLTNTHSVGAVRDGYIRWLVDNGRRPATNAGSDGFWALPVVGETCDGVLNDINGFHVRTEHVVAALQEATTGAVPEGSVGAGTGTIGYGHKAGIGTSSRRLRSPGPYVVGALVQTNCGKLQDLTIAGVPVGRELGRAPQAASAGDGEAGSIIVVVATDAPVLPHQAARLAKRAAMGLARTGSFAANGSGDLFVAFSTASLGDASQGHVAQVGMLANEALSPLFEAVVQATEEAIVNSLFAAETMRGVHGRTAPGLPLDRVQAILRRYRRLEPSTHP